METDEERYDIQGKLGEGGRGTVYLARDRQLNRTVAIKRLSTDKENAEEAYQAILHESRALSAINSPHIVRVFDVGQDEEGPYVVMEHLNGKTLHEVVSRAPLIESDFLPIAEQALEALIAAHEVHLLHRDIKPGNLMLNWLPSGRFNLKLLDFGLAKFSETPSVQTIAYGKSVMGSIYFMAPEQFERRPLDARTDLYSLGCVFFFSLTGEYPFDGENVAAVMASHLQSNHPALQSVRPDLPPALCEWVNYFIARDPDQRPASAQEALEALHEVKRGTFTRKAPAPISPQLTSSPPPPPPPPPTTLTPTISGPLLTPTPSTPSITTGAIPVAQLAPTATTGLSPTAATGLFPTSPTTGVVPTLGTAPVHTSRSGLPVWLLFVIALCAALIIGLGWLILNRGQPSPPPADPTPPVTTAPPKNSPPPPNPAFLKRDKDKDGKISLQEFFTSQDPQVQNRQELIFVRLDTDENGTLSPVEFAKR